MKLTELQKNLLAGMKSAGLDKETTATILSGLETERQQQEMENWIAYHIKTFGGYPNDGLICKALSIILEKFPTPEEKVA